MMHAQWKDEILKVNKYQDEDVMAETSSEAKRSHDLKYDILCMFAGETYEDGQFFYIVTKKKEGKQSLTSVLKEDGTVRSHMKAHTQLKKGISASCKC